MPVTGFRFWDCRTTLFLATSFLLFGAPQAKAQLWDVPPLPPVTYAPSPDGMSASVGNEHLYISVCRPSVIHFVAVPEAAGNSKSQHPWMLDAKRSCPGASFQVARSGDLVILTTGTLKLEFSLKWGNIKYSTIAGHELLRERNSIPRTYEHVVLNGENTFHVEDRFAPNLAEGFYGLGQHQSGLFNYRGATVELGQNNTDIAIPLLLSTEGYGMMWNTASLTYVDNRFPLELNLRSLAGHSLDYYFIYGPEMDEIIHLYRELTGHAPMLPKWAYGFFQSKDRYLSQDEVLGIAHKYREEHIPLDAIVQDWFWWKAEGDPVFNSNFPDVPAELQTLHDEHVHAMISVWGLFDPKSQNYQKLIAQHFDVPRAHVYDATNPKARDFYWSNLVSELFSQGWDAFWLDSAEPEEYWPHMGDAILQDKQIAIGNGAEYTNLFPFMHTLGIQQHWRTTTDRKRVFLLTRSAFLGQQRVGATVWSGDVYGNYWGLRHQVAAGLNFALSGYPYWTTDIGGYWPPHDNPLDDPKYQELYARWFEYGVFCPIFRTHGHRPQNEIWAFHDVEPILIKYDRLRYRLMPYIYSLAWRVANQDYTIQRPLVMDWRNDIHVRDIGDQFMFGPSILVSPVLQASATNSTLYLPDSPAWYDFWTGATVSGGHEIDVQAPLDRIPLYVRAGSILPLGPEIEFANEKPAGPIDLRIYRGADAQFNLYQDEGDNYDYEKGAHALIPLHWSEADKLFTIGKREGEYPGMPKSIEFRIIWVSPGHGAGETLETAADRVVQYNGEEISIAAP
ncbi:MAG TPA: TIM-barrel domain-containing protein [Candidatus Eisenbacteria bacterium]|nr:TIM-barrel domain-containing protein [Candidatus Eisenbacteria bacterium]